MPRLLLVNPNTSEGVTAAVLAEARRMAGPGTEFGTATAGFGVPVVSTPAEECIAAHAALDLLAAHHRGYDAAILAISFDSGVAAARTVLPVPVVGITEAGLHTACLLGRRFGLLVVGQVSLTLYQDLIDRIGLRGRMGALHVVEVETADAYRDQQRMEAAIRTAARALAQGGAVDVIVVAGAALAGIAHRIGGDVDLPILDGVGPAVAQAEALVRIAPRLRPAPPRLARGQDAPGLGDALTALLDPAHPYLPNP